MTKDSVEFVEELYQLIDKYMDRGMSPVVIIVSLQIVTRKLIELCNNDNSSSDFKIDGDLK